MSPKISFSPENAYLLWYGAWAVAGASLLWRHRATLRRETDGRTGWSGKPGTIAVYFGIYVALLLSMTGFGAGLARELVGVMPRGEGRDLALASAIIPALLAGSLLFIRHHVPELSPRRPHRINPPGPFGFTTTGILHGFAGAMTMVGVSALAWTYALEKTGLKAHTELQEQVRLLAQSSDPIVFCGIALGAVVFAPIHEEIVYRVASFGAMRARMASSHAYAISGLLFAAMHFNLNGLIPLAFLGAWLAWLYDTTADLRVPITIHALFNANTVLWTFLAPGAVG